MSLQFILGPSGSGKTRYLYEEIIRESMEHPETSYFVFVPEQSTMQTQKELIRLHPRHGLTNVDVLSFNRLAYRVFEDLAVETLTVLDDMGKSMILRKVAAEKKKELHYYQRHLNQNGFVNQLKSLLSELYQYGVTPNMLEELNQQAPKPILKEKLNDLEVMFRGFRDYIQNKFTTVEEVLDLCCRELPRWNKLSKSEIYLDGYTGFTPVQYRILELCMGISSRVRLAVTVDLSEPFYQEGKKEDLFYMSRHMICKLIDSAAKAGVDHESDILLNPNAQARFQNSPDLAYLERCFHRYGTKRGNNPPKAQNDREEIRIYQGRNPAKEVAFVCRQIERGLQKGLRYRDMAVITGDLPSYGREVEKQFRERGIPYFLDDKKSILSNPFVELIRSALETVRLDFPYESLFRCLKTGLVMDGSWMEPEEDEEGIQEELDRMENYVKALGIRGYKRWSSSWERTYRGAEKLNLEQLNQIRQAVVEIFEPFRQGLKKSDSTGASMAEELVRFLKQLSLEEKLQQKAKRLMEEGFSGLAKEYSQVYSLTEELLERLKGLLGDESMKLKEFSEILDAGFGEIQVATLPATVDRVVVGDLTRTRLDQIRILYLIGANEGVIPQRKENKGLLTDEEREFFADKQVELAPSAKENGLMQQFYLYLTLTKPSDQLVITYGAYTGSGKELRPSPVIREISDLFPDGRVLGKNQTLESYEPKTPETEPLCVPYSKLEAIQLLAEGLRDLEGERKKQTLELFSYLYRHPSCHQQAVKLAEAFSYCYQERGIGRAAARALYGRVLEGSVTRLELYAACAYSHFLRYGLELMERREYELGAVDMGNLFHQSLDFCFEALGKQGLSLASLSEDQRRELVTASVKKAAEDYGNTILQSSSRNAYLVRRISRITDRTMWALGEQLKKGEFYPAGFEVSFSAADQLNAMKIALSEDEALHLKGRIDRLDLSEDETHIYVKIIDYKSGSTSFDLAAIYYGLQLQLVVYMDAAVEMEERRHPDKEVIPAGLFYYHILDPMIEKKEEMTPEAIEDQIKKQLKMDGLVNSDLEVIKKLDREIEGESDVIPVAMKAGLIQEARSCVASGKRFGYLRDYVRSRCKKTGQEILKGEVTMRPMKQGNRTGCDYCPYHAVCGFDRKTAGYGYRKLKNLKPEEIWKEIIPEEEENPELDEAMEKGGAASENDMDRGSGQGN